MLLLTVTTLGAPAPAPKAEPYTGMEVYMGTLMAATLLAKGDNPSLMCHALCLMSIINVCCPLSLYLRNILLDIAH